MCADCTTLYKQKHWFKAIFFSDKCTITLALQIRPGQTLHDLAWIMEGSEFESFSKTNWEKVNILIPSGPIPLYVTLPLFLSKCLA